ncbi:MAG: 30S ribosomal protein S17 [Candidatus Kaiserbacteria bacterium]|nr:30S ribosomal protein S17 [Candidatus Kaiserbacteria bacterium]
MEQNTTHSTSSTSSPQASSVPSARPQSFTGVVVRTAAKDTAVVRVNRFVKNAKYKKYFVRSKNYLVHDQGNIAQIGDTVTIVATRPISKMKHFKIAGRGDTLKQGVTSSRPTK